MDMVGYAFLHQTTGFAAYFVRYSHIHVECMKPQSDKGCTHRELILMADKWILFLIKSLKDLSLNAEEV